MRLPNIWTTVCRFLLFALVTGTGVVLQADELAPWVPGQFAGLPVRMLFPLHYDAHKKYPLVVFLHGSGERGDDNVRQLNNGVQAFARPDFRARYDAIVVAPQCPTNQRWGGGQTTPTKAELQLIEMTKLISTLYPVDPSRIYLTGLSMGGTGTWDVVSRYPKMFAGALAMSGAPRPELAAATRDFPIWSIHGGVDTSVLPGADRMMAKIHGDMGSREIYTEVPGKGHDVWSAYQDTKVLDWLFRQRKQDDVTSPVNSARSEPNLTSGVL